VDNGRVGSPKIRNKSCLHSGQASGGYGEQQSRKHKQDYGFGEDHLLLRQHTWTTEWSRLMSDFTDKNAISHFTRPSVCLNACLHFATIPPSDLAKHNRRIVWLPWKTNDFATAGLAHWLRYRMN
jgi:hypothetical protein